MKTAFRNCTGSLVGTYNKVVVVKYWLSVQPEGVNRSVNDHRNLQFTSVAIHLTTNPLVSSHRVLLRLLNA